MKILYLVAWMWMPVFIIEFLCFRTMPAKVVAAIGAVLLFFAPIIVSIVEKKKKGIK